MKKIFSVTGFVSLLISCSLDEPIEISQEMTNILKKREKCDLIICISHLGHNYKTDKICDTKLAKMTSNIDLNVDFKC